MYHGETRKRAHNDSGRRPTFFSKENHLSPILDRALSEVVAPNLDASIDLSN